jgi:hypothetical protein
MQIVSVGVRGRQVTEYSIFLIYLDPVIGKVTFLGLFLDADRIDRWYFGISILGWKGFAASSSKYVRSGWKFEI